MHGLVCDTIYLLEKLGTCMHAYLYACLGCVAHTFTHTHGRWFQEGFRLRIYVYIHTYIYIYIYIYTHTHTLKTKHAQ